CTAIAARYSLTKPSPTLSATMTAMMMASVGSPVRPETPAATSSRRSRGLRSWPQSTARARTRCKPTTFGPYRSSRPAASAADRPESLLPSRFSTSCGVAAAAVARSIPALGATASARLVTAGSWAPRADQATAVPHLPHLAPVAGPRLTLPPQGESAANRPPTRLASSFPRPFLCCGSVVAAKRRRTAASASPMRSQDSVVIIACLSLRVGVHQRGGQPRQRVQQVVLGADRDLVRLDRADTAIDDDLTFGAQVVPNPAQPDLANPEHPWRCAQSLLNLIDQGRVGSVHQPPVDLPGRLPQHGQDGHRDQQANDRVGPVPADGHTAHSQQHRQRREAVGAGVQPVGDQRR